MASEPREAGQVWSFDHDLVVLLLEPRRAGTTVGLETWITLILHHHGCPETEGTMDWFPVGCSNGWTREA